MALPFSSLAAIDSEAPSAGTDPVLGKKFIKAVRRGSGVAKAALRFKQYGGKYGSDDELAAGLGGYKTRQERLGQPVPSTAQALGTHAATQQGDGGAVAASVGDKRSRRRSKRHSTGSQNTATSPAGQNHAPQPQQRLPRVTTLQRVTAQLLQDDEEQGEAAAPSEQTAQQPASAATARVATRKDTKRLLEAATDGNLQVTRQIVESEGIAPNVKGQEGQTAIMQAAAAGKRDTVEYLIKQGASLAFQDSAGNTVLHHACESGNVATCALLLHHYPAVINIANNDGLTPLAVSTILARPRLMELFLRGAHANPDVPDNDGATPTLRAASLGRTRELKLLIQSGADINAAAKNGITPLMSAAEGGHLECVKVLLGRRRLRINARENFQAATALFIAARQGQANVVRLIANAGADINLPESVEGFTPLHIAAWNGHEDVLDMLLGQPAANIFAVTKRLLTVQDLAARKGHTAVTRLLLEFLNELPLVSEPIRGLLSPSRQEQASSFTPHHLVARRAKKNGLDDAAAAKKALHSMNNSALVQATAEGHGETAAILLKAGADPNFVDVKNNGSTPLLLACKFNHVAIAKSLLNAKGDPNIAEKAYGLTPLMAAASIGSVELVKLLCDAGAAVDAQNKHKSTALMIACQENHIAVAKILLAYSADLGKQDVHGATAIMRACFVADGAPLVALLLQMCPGDKHQLVNIQADDGTTALMVAAERGRLATVKCLLEQGQADVRVVDSSGASALVLAKRRANNDQVVALLTHHAAAQGRVAAAAIDLQANQGSTPHGDHAATSGGDGSGAAPAPAPASAAPTTSPPSAAPSSHAAVPDARRVSVARVVSPLSDGSVPTPAPLGSTPTSTQGVMLRGSSLQSVRRSSDPSQQLAAVVRPPSSSGTGARRSSVGDVQDGVRMTTPMHREQFFLYDNEHAEPVAPDLATAQLAPLASTMAQSTGAIPAGSAAPRSLKPTFTFRVQEGDRVTHQGLAAVSLGSAPRMAHLKLAHTPGINLGAADGAQPSPRTQLGHVAYQTMLAKRVRRKLRINFIDPPAGERQPQGRLPPLASTDGTTGRGGGGETGEAATGADDTPPAALAEGPTSKAPDPGGGGRMARKLRRAVARATWTQPLVKKFTQCSRGGSSAD